MQFSKILTADTQDVLAGSVVGVLGNAPSYDVEVRVAAYDPAAATTAADAATVTLVVNGVSILQNCRSYTVNQGGNAEPRSDAPLCTFNVAGGSRMILNVDLADNTNASVYVEARENSNPAVSPSITHVGRMTAAANGGVQDVLAGTIVSQVPADQVYEVSLMVSGSSSGGLCTLLIDSDTVTENFAVPYRTEELNSTALERDQFGVTDRDTVITVLAQPSSTITLNFNAGTSAVNFIYAVAIDPV